MQFANDLFQAIAKPAPAPAHRVVGAIPLRWCQREDCDAMIAAIEGGAKHPCAVGATGYGKGPMIAETVGRVRSAGKVVCLINRAHLVHQLADEIERHLGTVVGRVADGECEGLTRNIVVATVQAMYTPDRSGKPLYAYSQFKDTKAVVGDEAHTLFADTYRSVLTHFVEGNGAVTPLFTATPVASNGAKWESFVDWTPEAEGPCMRTAGWCIRNGYLVKPRQAFVSANLDLTAIHQRLLSGSAVDAEDEDSGDEVADVLRALLDEKNERDAGAFAAGVASIISNHRTIVFAPARVKVAKSLASWISATGRLTCDAVWGGRADKANVLNQFRYGSPQALVNVNLLCEGFNDPYVSAVFICRLLNNWRLIQQMVGRCLRPHPDVVDQINALDGPDRAAERRAAIAASPKPEALVADLVGIDGKVMQASAIDILYADESEDVRGEIAQATLQRQSKPRDEGERPDKAELELAREAVLRRQHDQLAELARRRAMAGDIPADVQVSYAGGMAPASPSIPTAKTGATLGEKARFVAMAVKYDRERAQSIADRTPRNQLRGMTASLQRELTKSKQQPDWRRARQAYPEWANQKVGA